MSDVEIKLHRPRRPRARLARWLWRLSLAYLAALVLLYLVEALLAERTWPTLLLTYVCQYPFFFPSIMLLPASLLLRHRRSLAVSVAALALVCFGLIGLAVPRWRGTSPPGATVRVMTLNSAYCHDLEPSDLARLVAQHHLDVVSLQESSLGDSALARQFLAVLPGWRVVTEDQLSVLSRLPVRSRRVHRYTDGDRAALLVQLELGKTPFTIISTHFTTAYPPRRLRSDWRALGLNLNRHNTIRRHQTDELLDLVRERHALGEPVLVTGDFNTPPRGRIYRQLASHLQDSFAATGWGTGYSFPSIAPIYRIDYLWAGVGVEPRTCQRLLVRVSDHCPVVGEFVVLNGTAP